MGASLSESPLRRSDVTAGAVTIAHVIERAAVRAMPVFIGPHYDKGRHVGLREQPLPPPAFLRVSKHSDLRCEEDTYMTAGEQCTSHPGLERLVRQAERLPRLSLSPTGLADGFGEGVT